MAALIKAVIWDMGGVLLQEHDPVPRVELAAAYGLKLNQLYELVFQSRSAKLAGLGLISEDEHWGWIGQSVNVPPAELTNFQSQFWSGDGIDPSIMSFIQELKGNYQIALLSNAWSGARKVLKEYYKCFDLFDEVIISAEMKVAKPDPAIYKEMLSRLHVQPGEAIFVDDLQENIAAANELGIHGIYFQSTGQAIADVRQLLEL